MLNFYWLQVSEQHRPQIRVYITHLEAGIQYWQKSTEREREKKEKKKVKIKQTFFVKTECKNIFIK